MSETEWKNKTRQLEICLRIMRWEKDVLDTKLEISLRIMRWEKDVLKTKHNIERDKLDLKLEKGNPQEIKLRIKCREEWVALKTKHIEMLRGMYG